MRGDVRAIIGRSSERAVLERFLDEAGRGPAGLLLEGEVGIGKTELWREGIRAAVARSYCVLACRPDDSETSLAYAALGDLLEPELETVQCALAPLRRRALETALLRGETGTAADRRAVSLAVFDALRLLATRSPVLLAVDDLQWLDGSTADVRGGLLVVASRSQAAVGVLEEVVGSHERTVAQLGAAVEAGVLEVDQGRLRFAHPLLREVLYAEAGRKERRRVHRRLAHVVR